MFQHAKSPNCIFQEKCLNRLCQFKHENRNTIKSTIRNSSEQYHPKVVNDTSEMEKESDEEEELDDDGEYFTPLECQECHELFESHDTLIEHVEKLHIEEEDIPRDYLFPTKCPNCPKWIYLESEMEMHYDNFDEYGSCEYKTRM
jgi:uncharacterized C2H2 Zn-finger protein